MYESSRLTSMCMQFELHNYDLQPLSVVVENGAILVLFNGKFKQIISLIMFIPPNNLDYHNK